MATVDTANPPQEYPDIVGARPTNPLAANFKPFIPASVQLPELIQLLVKPGGALSQARLAQLIQPLISLEF